MLKAPRAKHTVKYVNDDGTEISVQTVLDGEKANVPDSPKKTGYLFTGWSDNATQVYEDMIIVASYVPIQYVVAFVDSANGTVSCDVYNYGDKIIKPENPTAEGKIFIKWDKLNSTDSYVTGNMIINAIYETQTYSVDFLNEMVLVSVRRRWNMVVQQCHLHHWMCLGKNSWDGVQKNHGGMLGKISK